MTDDITIGTSLDTNDPFKVDANSIIMGRSLIASVTRYGKSWTNRRIVEQLVGKAGIVIIDPESEYSSLRSEFPFLIIGKDVPLQVETAEFLAETTLKEELSVIIDLSMVDIEIGKEFVSSFINRFMFLETTAKKPYLFVVEECLAPDEVVLIKMNGQMHYLTMSELWERMLPLNQVISDGCGGEKVILNQLLEVEGWKEDRLSWVKVKQLIRHSSAHEIVSVHSPLGDVNCTPNESLFVRNVRWGLKPKSISDLSPHNRTCIVRPQSESSQTVINGFDELKRNAKTSLKTVYLTASPEAMKNTLEHPQNWPIVQDFLRVHKQSLNDLIRRRPHIPFELACKLTVLDLSKFEITKHQRVPALIAVSPELGFLTGLFLSEGSFTGHDASVVNNTDLRIIRAAQHNLKAALGLVSRPFIASHGKSPCWRLTSAFFGFVAENMLGIERHPAYLKRVPSFILSAPRIVKKAFLTAYILGDGCVDSSGKYKAFKITTTSRLMAAGLIYLARSLNLRTRSWVRRKRREMWHDEYSISIAIGSRLRAGDGVDRIRYNLNWTKPRIRKHEPSNLVHDLTTETGNYVAGTARFLVHNCDEFAPERGVAKATSLEAMKNLAKKGGKRGLGLIITTHRPAFVSKMVLSQCTTLKMIGRIEWDSDLDVIKEFLQVSPLVLRRPRQNGKPTSDGLPHVDSLEPGQFYIGGSAVELEGFVKVGSVKSAHLGATPDLVPPTPKELAAVVKRLSASLPQIIAQKLKPTVDVEAIKKEVEIKANAKAEEKLAAFKRKVEAENQSTVLNLRNEVKALTERLDTASRAASFGAAPITDPFEHPIVKNTMTKLSSRAQQLLMKIERQPGLNREQLAAFLTSSKDVVVNVIDEVNRTFKAEVIVDDGCRPVKYLSMLRRLYIQDVGKREISKIEELLRAQDKLRESYDDLRGRYRVLESELMALKETLKHRPTYEELAKVQEQCKALAAELKQSALQLKKQEQAIRLADRIFSAVEQLVKEVNKFRLAAELAPVTPGTLVRQEFSTESDGLQHVKSTTLLPEKTPQSTDAKIDVSVTLVERLDFTLREKLIAFLQKHSKTWFREQELTIALGDGKLFHETFLSLKDCQVLEMSEQGVRSK